MDYAKANAIPAKQMPSAGKKIIKILDIYKQMPYNNQCCDEPTTEYRGIAKLVRHWILNPAFVGSSPATPAIEN